MVGKLGRDFTSQLKAVKFVDLNISAKFDDKPIMLPCDITEKLLVVEMDRGVQQNAANAQEAAS